MKYTPEAIERMKACKPYPGEAMTFIFISEKEQVLVSLSAAHFENCRKIDHMHAKDLIIDNEEEYI